MPHKKSANSAAQAKILWVLWIAYGSFYFCRNNLSVALPGLQAELGYSKTQLGTVLMALKLAYGSGQFINGQLAERFAPRKLMAIGLMMSAALNLLFGWATALYWLTFIWACNGYFQALGWTPTMRVAANWFAPSVRGRAIGIISTGYQLCAALTYVLAGWAAQRFGWRGALYIPAGILVISAIHMWVALEEQPPAAAAEGEPENASGSHAQKNKGPNAAWHNLSTTLSNPALWIVAIVLCLLDATRYGFTDWGVTHLKEVQGEAVSSAAFKYAVLPFGGIIGSLVSGWMSDRLFNGRRAPVICLLLLTLGGLAVAYNTVLHWGLIPSVIILFLIGFCIFGPQVLLVGTLPVDLARRGTPAAAAGFVNFMGYMGAAAGDKITGHLAQDYGWQLALFFWAGCAMAGAAIIATLWNTKAGAKPIPSTSATPLPGCPDYVAGA